MKLSRRRSAAVLGAGCAAAVAVTASLLAGSPAGAVASGCVDPPDYAHTIPAAIGAPAAAPAAGNSVYFATVGGDRKTYVVETTIEQPGLLVDRLQCVGGGAVGTPTVVPYAAGTALYVLGTNGAVYESYRPKEGPQTTWLRVPGAPAGGGAPVVTLSGSGEAIEMFVRGRDNQLYHASRGVAADGTWSAWEKLGGGLTGVAGAGALEDATVVVVRAPNGTLYQKTGRTGAWGGWARLTGTTSASPALASGFGTGRLDLFVTGSTGGLYQAAWLPGARGFGAFRKITTDLPVGASVAAAGRNGRMIVYATVRTGSASVVGFDQYVPRVGWSGFQLAPYTCGNCLPAADAVTARRSVPPLPMG
ncbi:MAG TPA: hypothetical protein VLM05_10180 [Mycobacteriales bacterium]|nr:hypothetical protein [Mycobacteriales bacterium]